MNKKLLKNILITIGIIYLFIILLLNLHFNYNIIESLCNMFGGLFINFNIIFLPGIISLIAGFMIDTKQTEPKQNSIKKYIKLRILGLIPFIGILCYAFLSTIVGASFMGSDIFGFDAFILVLLACFMSPWSWLGLVLIIISTLKIKKSKTKKQLILSN